MKFSCNSNNVGYRLECEICIEKGKMRVYEGESTPSDRIGGAEHLADYENQRSNNVLLKQKLNEHQPEEMRIKMKITRKFKDPLSNYMACLLRSPDTVPHGGQMEVTDNIII